MSMDSFSSLLFGSGSGSGDGSGNGCGCGCGTGCGCGGGGDGNIKPSYTFKEQEISIGIDGSFKCQAILAYKTTYSNDMLDDAQFYMSVKGVKNVNGTYTSDGGGMENLGSIRGMFGNITINGCVSGLIVKTSSSNEEKKAKVNFSATFNTSTKTGDLTCSAVFE